MNVAKDSEVETPDPEAIWLELSFEGQTLAFELPADESRAIAVGSLLRADIRIDRPGVAPVHFHFEREDDEIWVVPGYGLEGLRVDTARVTGPKRIDARAVVEFCGTRLEATVLDEPPSPRRRASLVRLRQSGFSECAVRGPSQTFGEQELGATGGTEPAPPTPAVAAPTVSIDRAVIRTPLPLEQPTTRFVPLTTPIECVERTAIIEPCRVAPLAVGHEKEPTTLRTGEVPSTLGIASTTLTPLRDLTPPDTIETRPFWLDEPSSAAEEVAQPSRAAAVPSPPRRSDEHSTLRDESRSETPVPTTPVAIYAIGEPPASTNTPKSPVAVSTPKASTETGPALDVVAAPAENPPPPQEADTQQTTYFEPVRISQAPFAPESQDPSPRKPAPEPLTPASKVQPIVGWLSHLGMLSKRRPLLVWVVGALTVFALSATIAKVSRNPKPAAHLSVKPTAITTERAASPKASSTPVSPALGHGPAPLVVIPAIAPTTSTKTKKGQPANPELVAAVSALISGHYIEARATYTRLSAEALNNLALQTTMTLLEKKLSPECSSRTPTSVVSCPEIKQ